MKRLKKVCLLESSFFILVEAIALRRFGGTEHESFLVCSASKSGYLTYSFFPYQFKLKPDFALNRMHVFLSALQGRRCDTKERGVSRP